MLIDYIIYNYNDLSLAIYQISKGIYPEIKFGSIDFISNYIFYFFISSLGTTLGSNLLFLIYTSISIYISFILFNSITKNRILSIILSITYSLSIHYIYRVTSLTVNLYPIFFFPLIIYLLLRNIKTIYISFILVLFSSLSTYYAFFAGLLIIYWYIFNKRFKDLVLFILVSISLIFFFYLNLAISNIGLFQSLGTSNSNDKVIRPIEDWYNFSIRPWYFIIPPKNSLFLGSFSKSIHEQISSTGNYLTQNYNEEEMAGLFIGWHFIISTVFLYLYVFIKKFRLKLNTKFIHIDGNISFIKFLLTLNIFILLITLPPTVTIKGFTIYTPTYLLYEIVPFFRVLTRWSSVLFLSILIANAYLILDIIEFLKSSKTKLKILYVSLIIANILMFSVKIPIIDINNKPIEFRIVESNTKGKYMVLPTSYNTLFWASTTKQDLYLPSLTSDLKKLNENNLNYFKTKDVLFEIDTIVLYKGKLNVKDFKNIIEMDMTNNSVEEFKNYLNKDYKTIFENENLIILKNLNDN